MPLFHNVTRGGQVHIHQLRMIRQVIWFALAVSFFTSLGYVSYKAHRVVPNWAWQALWEYHVAELNVMSQPSNKEKLVRQMYHAPGMIPYARTSYSIIHDKAIEKLVFKIEGYLIHLLWQSAKIGGWSFFIALLGWSVMGYYHRRKKKHRGNEIVPFKRLARRLRWTFKASDLKLGGLPLVKNLETHHILFSGTTGSGKSNAFHTLLPQVRKRKNAAIIVDVEGDMVSRYFREGKDIILNPFDVRSHYWDLWAELESEPLLEVFAKAVIPPIKDAESTFWENASRTVLVASLTDFKQRGETSPRKLYETLVYSDPKQFEEFFKGTEAATYSQEKGEKFTMSVRASLQQYTKFFKHLPEYQGGRTFSFRKWIQSEPKDQWIFLTAKQDWLEVLMPLISGWCDLSTSALMSLKRNRKRRIWLFLDELPALNVLPCLMNSLSRVRKYGGCVLAGVQTVDQLEKIYGRTGSKIMLNLFNTKVFFRNEEPDTAAWISRLLGEREDTEVIENLSYGANTTRDGVSLNQQTKTTRLVIPTEVAMLKDFEAYVKLPGHYPVTKIKIPFVKARDMAEDFVPV